MSQLDDAQVLIALLAHRGPMAPRELCQVARGEGIELSVPAFNRRVALAVAAGVVFRDGGQLVASPTVTSASSSLSSPALVLPPTSLGRAEALQSSTAQAAANVFERSRRHVA